MVKRISQTIKKEMDYNPDLALVVRVIDFLSFTFFISFIMIKNLKKKRRNSKTLTTVAVLL